MKSVLLYSGAFFGRIGICQLSFARSLQAHRAAILKLYADEPCRPKRHHADGQVDARQGEVRILRRSNGALQAKLPRCGPTVCTVARDY